MVTKLSTTVTTNSRRLLAALALGLTACWLFAPSASAHAAYESSSPAFAERLSESPSEISIRFTQELFRREGANTMELVDTQSSDLLADYAIDPVRINNDDRKLMSAAIPVELPPGRYAVRWTNLSAEDGDTDSGWLPFYVQREPEPWQIDEDRQLAQELLIAYPGDVDKESEVAAIPTPATPAVVRTDTGNDASLGIGPILWLGLGIVAALVAVSALGYYLGGRRRDT